MEVTSTNTFINGSETVPDDLEPVEETPVKEFEAVSETASEDGEGRDDRDEGLSKARGLEGEINCLVFFFGI